MGPYTKKQSSSVFNDGWNIYDGQGELIAALDTDTMANGMLACLVGHFGPPPDYPSDTPLGDDDAGLTPMYCQDCGHSGEENEFWPSDGNPAPHVCPNCGRTNIFTKDES